MSDLLNRRRLDLVEASIGRCAGCEIGRDDLHEIHGYKIVLKTGFVVSMCRRCSVALALMVFDAESL